MAIIPQQISDLLQYRIQQEEQSARIYKAMSVWLNLHGYTGASKLWQKYSDEERVHVEWAYNYLLDLNILPITPAQQSPQVSFRGLPQIIALSYQHEVEITEQCQSLAKAAFNAGDMMTFDLAQKYVKEQVEELAKTQLWIDKLESFGDSNIVLLEIDEQMGELAE